MVDPAYIIVQEFLKVEALGTWGSQHGCPADPIRIEAYVTPSDSIATIVEKRDTNIPSDSENLYRVSLGNWAFKLIPDLYTIGRAYTIVFRFWATQNNLNVVRQNFVWDPIPELPHEPQHCIIFGTLNDVAGHRVSNQYLVVERYKNLVTLNEREAQSTVKTDAFGLWSIELPIGAIVRIVFGNITKAIKVPAGARVALNEIEDYQPGAALRDKFGYPFPSGEKAPLCG